MAAVAVLFASIVSWLASFRVLVMMNPGKAKGGSLMFGFLTLASGIHCQSVAVLPLILKDST